MANNKAGKGGRPTNHELRYKNTGRPTIVTPEVLSKLEYAFALGATDNAACFYADISPSTLYNYQNANPAFLERKQVLKDSMIMKALETVNNGISKDATATWFLEKKHHDFKAKQEVTHKIEIDPEKKQEIDKAIENIFE